MKVHGSRSGLFLVTLLVLPMLGGCCGITNVQASGGGTGGLASLGVLMLGSEAMKRLCDRDTTPEPEDAPLPPETRQEDTDQTVKIDNPAASAITLQR